MDWNGDKLYVSGDVDRGNLAGPIETAIALFVINYCENKDILCHIVPYGGDNKEGELLHLPLSCVHNLLVVKQMQEDVGRCTLPAMHTGCMVRTGLCAVLRHIIKTTHNQAPHRALLSLLGYKGICLKSCAEVSVWTKFCEVEMPQCVHDILRQDGECEILKVPQELMKLENHLGEPAIVPNISKRIRAMKKSHPASDRKDSQDGLEHVYAEGTDMTLTDLILYPCVTCFLNQYKDDLEEVKRYIPRILSWYNRLYKDPHVSTVMNICGLPTVHLKPRPNMDRLIATSHECNSLNVRDPNKKKFKAHPTQINYVLEKLSNCGIVDTEELHPCGTDIHLPWDDLPSGVNPVEGDLPGSRVARKCEQLENLARAVEHVAHDGAVIVDFCSGGGHLGIIIAHLLPACKVILVENKEESIVRAEKRIQSLGLTNVIMYQCNMDYFVGSFDIGVCLHACGVATDLVLQRCLDNQAAFVICPCCYGGIQNTHTMEYPCSRMFKERNVTYDDYLVLGHAADQTQVGIKQATNGKKCMLLIDTDRAASARELNYDVTLCSLQPLSCSPKNNLLVGTPRRVVPHI